MDNNLVLEFNDIQHYLIQQTLRILGKKSKFDTIRIYELETRYEVITICSSQQYVTRTYIGKHRYKILESYYKIAGEEEIQIYKRKI